MDSNLARETEKVLNRSSLDKHAQDNRKFYSWVLHPLCTQYSVWIDNYRHGLKCNVMVTMTAIIVYDVSIFNYDTLKICPSG